SVLSPAKRHRTHSRAWAAPATEPAGDDAAAARLNERHPAVWDRACKLDRTGTDHRPFRTFGSRGLYDRHSHRDLLSPAVVGTEQRRGDTGRAKPGPQAARSRGTGGVA